MSASVEEVRLAIGSGKSIIAATVESPFELARSLSTEDPVSEADGRPVMVWDVTDGLIDMDNAAALPPDLNDLQRAVGFAERFSGPAIFVFILDGVDLSEEEDALRRKVKMLAGQFTSQSHRALVLASEEPLPESVARVCEAQVGQPVPIAASGAGRKARSRWYDVRDLSTFAAYGWTQQINALTADEVSEIVDGNHHAEAVARVRELRERMKKRFARKETLIDLMTYAMVAQVPMVLLGPPGTAKSAMIRAFCEGLGLESSKGAAAEPAEGEEAVPPGGLFEYLLTRYTTPEEIFGPVHIGDLIHHQKYRRVTTGRLPESEVGFLDEIFKASSAIVNTLLTILNERVFHNAGTVQKVPLVMVFAASNEPPQDPSLAALYDRFPLRANCGRVADEHVDELWQRSWEMGFDKRFHPENLAFDQIACTNDFRLLHRVAMVRYGGRALQKQAGLGAFDFNTEFLRVFRSLRREYDISDRTLGSLYSVARAMAVLESRPQLSSEELNVFRYVSWDESGSGELDRLVSSLKRGVNL